MRNRCCYWAQLPTNSRGEYTTSAKVAEGEELGSNLLRATKSIAWGHSGLVAGEELGRSLELANRLGVKSGTGTDASTTGNVCG